MRYLLFVGEEYYACGGGHDFLAAGDDLDALILQGEVRCRSDGDDAIDWWHVFDIEQQQIVEGSKRQAHGESYRRHRLEHIHLSLL